MNDSFLQEQGVSGALIESVRKFRESYPVAEGLENRMSTPEIPFFGKEILEMAIAALLQGENLLLTGEKATGKNRGKFAAVIRHAALKPPVGNLADNIAQERCLSHLRRSNEKRAFHILAVYNLIDYSVGKADKLMCYPEVKRADFAEGFYFLAIADSFSANPDAMSAADCNKSLPNSFKVGINRVFTNPSERRLYFF